MPSPLYPRSSRQRPTPARNLADLIRIARELPEEERLGVFAQQAAAETGVKSLKGLRRKSGLTGTAAALRKLDQAYGVDLADDKTLSLLTELFGPAPEFVQDTKRASRKVPGRVGGPKSVNLTTKTGQLRKRIDIQQPDGKLRRFSADDPVITGAMVRVSSSNVHSIGYDIDHSWLYVRFLQDGKAGSLYRYDHVSVDQFTHFRQAISKGGWVWDHLRVRGTVSLHRKPYSLAGTIGRYVPRQAMMLNGREWFVRREVQSRERRGKLGNSVRSALPTAPVRGFGQRPTTS